MKSNITSNNNFLESRVSKLSTYIGIPIFGIITAFVFLDNDIAYFSIEFFAHMLISTIITSFYWLTSRWIVKKLWKKYPWHLEPLKHILIEVPALLFSAIAITSLSWLVFYFTREEMMWDTLKFNITIIILLVLFLSTYHEALFFFFQWKENFNKSAVLEKEKMEARYESLKNQVNPHFLFNSLNTLLSQVKENSETSNYIHNLSDFLRYSLQDDELGIKALNDEINIVKNYCFLQKSRFGKNLQLTMEVPAAINHFALPKLSLQMLVENAIKHNIISDEKPLYIRIYIKDEYIVVENNLQKRFEEESTKQGLTNIRKRYKFLSAKDILIQEKNDKFTVELPLLTITTK
ncbi:MAG: hypothetical protein DRJ05_18845 [Bacteroidetes bacterium]|nr:MAG: hypothetical protein DRJ05_18845 [Bacteroidota bacterium]